MSKTEKDYYQILELTPEATQEEIQTKYRKLTMVFHPDYASNTRQKEYFEEKLKDINKAYGVLSNPAERKIYDSQFKAQKHKQSEIFEVSPRIVDFGTLVPGEGKSSVIILDYVGKSEKLKFDPPSCSWLKFGKITKLNPPEKLPIQIELVANANGLTAGRNYSEILLFGIGNQVAKVSVILKVQDNPIEPTVPKTFRFRSGDIAQNPIELVPLCDRHWDEAKSYLYDDKQFVQWFIDIRRNDLVALVEESRKASTQDIGLENFLKGLNPKLVGPRISVETKLRDIPKYDFSSSKQAQPKIIIKNGGRGCCYGTVEVNSKEKWLTLRNREFAVPAGKTIEIILDVKSSALIWESRHSAKATITSNSENLKKGSYTFTISTPRYPGLTEVETLRSEGKWQLALEKLEDIRNTSEVNPIAEKLEASIAEEKTKFLIKVSLINFFLYAAFGGFATNIFWDPDYTWGIGFAGALLGPVISLVFNTLVGGKKGRTWDYVFSILAPLGVVLAVALVAGLIYLIVQIIIAIFLIILAFAAIGAILGGG